MNVDPNFQPHKYVYVLMLEGSFVCPYYGFVSGVGAWMHAKQFQCYRDADEARKNPFWHNTPSYVEHAEIVRLKVSVEVKFYR